MKRLMFIAALVVAAITAALAVGTVSASAATCTPTGFFRDGINLSAAQIGGNVTGTLDATSCNIGVYYGPGTTATVSGTISGANYYGVVVDRASVNVTGAMVQNIGETPANGTQHGVAVLYTTIELTNDASNTFGTVAGHATGTLSGSTISGYQKNGVVVTGVGSSATISGNTVTGAGAVPYIAQNGIEVGYGATASISSNSVSANAYTGTNNASSTGILVFGGPAFDTNFYSGAYTTGVSVSKNTLTNNDVGVDVYNAQADGSAPATMTKNTVANNTITNNLGASNVSGNISPDGYQAGISDLGNHDSLVNNKISGSGYDSANEPTTGSLYTKIDTSGSARTTAINSNK